ncbi:MAG TPA: serine/threonine-protein kinase [bacterium]|nr:serine/threonine-protein kinase [bacterium]
MITINLLPSAQTRPVSLYTAAVGQLMAAGREALQANAFIERAQQILEKLPEATPFAARIQGFIARLTDLSSDDSYSPEAAEALLKRLRHRDADLSLIPGCEHLEPIGHGGFSTVYRGLDLETGGLVAVKVGQLVQVDEDKKRILTLDTLRRVFDEEWNALSRIDSPRVVKPIRRGVTDRGKPYIVTEYLPGGTVSQWARLREACGLFDMRTTFYMAMQMVEAVAASHASGIVHGDIKLSQFLLTAKDAPKLADFNLSTSAGADSERARRNWSGTPGRRSVETKESPRKDVYGLGVALYELFTGKELERPKDRADLKASLGNLYRLLSVVQEIRPPSEARPERRIHKGIDRILLKALKPAPGDRYPNAAAMLEDLRKLERLLNRRRSKRDADA